MCGVRGAKNFLEYRRGLLADSGGFVRDLKRRGARFGCELKCFNASVGRGVFSVAFMARPHEKEMIKLSPAQSAGPSHVKTLPATVKYPELTSRQIMPPRRFPYPTKTLDGEVGALGRVKDVCPSATVALNCTAKLGSGFGCAKSCRKRYRIDARVVQVNGEAIRVDRRRRRRDHDGGLSDLRKVRAARSGD